MAIINAVKKTQKSSSQEDNPLSFVRMMTNYKITTEKNKPGCLATITDTELGMPVYIMRGNGKTAIITDRGQIYKTFYSPIKLYFEAARENKKDKDMSFSLFLVIKALMSSDIRIMENNSLTVTIPSLSPENVLAGCIMLFTAIEPLQNFNKVFSQAMAAD